MFGSHSIRVKHRHSKVLALSAFVACAVLATERNFNILPELFAGAQSDEAVRILTWPRAVVTGASRNHEATLVSFLQNFHKNNRESIPLVVYDLGLSSPSLTSIQQQYPWATIRRFDYASYPKFFDIDKAQGEYAWKPVIIKEMLDTTASVVLWLDSGDKLTHPDSLTNVLQSITRNGYFTTETSGTVANWVHPGMLRYLEYSDEQKPMCNGAIVGFNIDSPHIYEEVVLPWARCALDRACIAPKGSSRANHRQDQSALTVLLHMTGRNCSFKADIALHTDID